MLIFDMDGLIFDSERVVQRSWNKAGEILGYGSVGEQIYHTLGFNVKRREEYFKSIYGEDFPMEQFGELTRKYFFEIAVSHLSASAMIASTSEIAFLVSFSIFLSASICSCVISFSLSLNS